MGWFDRLKQGLRKTHDRLVNQIASVLRGRRLDEALLEELEEILIGADLGVETTLQIIDAIQERARREGVEDSEKVLDWLREILAEILEPAEGFLNVREDGQPTVMLVLGVNGSGKTTSIAKLAQRLREQGFEKITIAAADTFRAAAIEQLEIWAERVDAKLVKHQAGADPGAVAYDAVDYAINHRQDVVLIDTAGRLHTKHNLMEELKKIQRVVEKRLGREVDERLLVLDATIGQNALSQAKIFHEAVPLTGLVITKLDGTAKGGIIVAIAKELKVPIKFIGVGESAEDLREFKAREFVEALLS
jgi:fused signal recognition particle receptor